MGNALHYTQIKKSDLKFEPFAEFLAEDGDWMDLTIISDSPLLEHDAMFMQQHHDKARERLLEIMARDEQRMRVMARSEGASVVDAPVPQEVAEAPAKDPPKPKKASSMMSFEDDATDDDLF